MKKVLSLAIAAALVAPAAAMADATLFGKAHFILEKVDTTPSTGANSTDMWGVDSIHSRVGVKGAEDLGNGLKAVYHFEFKVDPDSGSTLGNRNQFVGLAGGFGTFLMGRHDTPMKMSQGKFDQFGDLPNGDITGVMPGEDRLSNVMAYVSPAMGGLTVVAATVAGENAAYELDGPADHISVAGLYGNGPVFASLAINSYDLGNVNADPQLIRGTFIWNGGSWQVGGMVSKMDLDLGVDGDDSLQYGVSGNVKVGAGKIKAQYLMGESERIPVTAAASGFTPNVGVTNVVGTGTAENEVTQISVGYEHALSKRTTVHAGYTMYEEDGTGKEVDALFGGIIHNF
jgi:predicted porin